MGGRLTASFLFSCCVFARLFVLRERRMKIYMKSELLKQQTIIVHRVAGTRPCRLFRPADDRFHARRSAHRRRPFSGECRTRFSVGLARRRDSLGCRRSENYTSTPKRIFVSSPLRSTFMYPHTCVSNSAFTSKSLAGVGHGLQISLLLAWPTVAKMQT